MQQFLKKAAAAVFFDEVRAEPIYFGGNVISIYWLMLESDCDWESVLF